MVCLSVSRNGYISLEDYMSFMISRETENVQSIAEVESAFRAITAQGDKPFVTKDEMFQVPLPTWDSTLHAPTGLYM